MVISMKQTLKQIKNTKDYKELKLKGKSKLTKAELVEILNPRSLKKSTSLVKSSMKQYSVRPLPTIRLSKISDYLYGIYKGNVLLAKSYQNQNVIGWWYSEKYDGYRALWTGHELLTRNGNKINAPVSFTNLLPRGIALDGELWLGYCNFEDCGLFRKKKLNSSDLDLWDHVQYIVFDLPAVRYPFETRMLELEKLVKYLCYQIPNCPIINIKNDRIISLDQIDELMSEIKNRGGEGLMLREPGSYYEGKRSNTLLKIKFEDDMECTITDYKSGTGKYSNILGAFECTDDNGNKFFVSGMNDQIRQDYLDTHPIGTKITIIYNGLTKNSIPRHPRYLRKYIPN